MTALTFEALKEGRPEPEAELAMQVGLEAGAAAEAGGGPLEADSLAAEDVLTRLPGVTPRSAVSARLGRGPIKEGKLLR